MHKVEGQGALVHAGPVRIEDLERRLEVFDRRLDQFAQADRLARMAVLAATVLAVTMMAWFASSLWRLAEEQFTEKKIQAALMTKVQNRWPGIQQRLVDEVFSAAPQVGTLVIERLGKVWPQLSERLIASLQSLGQDMETEVRDRSEAALRRVAAKLSDDVRRDFPAFTPERANAMCERIHDEVLADGGAFVGELEGVIKQEQEKVAALLARLPLGKVADLPEGELQKKFIHHVLMMIDAIVEQQPVAGDGAAAVVTTPALAVSRNVR